MRFAGKVKHLPTALTVAGSDSGGGAGIQADLKTFVALGVHGTSAITCLTAQNPQRVTKIQAASPAMVRAQIEAVFEELPPKAVKTGMLFSMEIIQVVAAWRRKHARVPVVVDPVMVATSGAKLLQPAAIKALCSDLLPQADLITPNIPEAECLLGLELGSLDEVRQAARELQARFGCAVLLKGGHLPGAKEAVDVFFDGRREVSLAAPYVRGLHLHGTGCTYSAAIAAFLARGSRMIEAVGSAKEYITRAIRGHVRVGRHTVLGKGC